MTEFREVVCWRKERISAVLSPEADYVDDDIFAAVHTDLPIRLLDVTPDSRPGVDARHWTMPSDEFLRQFLSPDRHHVQAVVLGDAGAGKSHFIHWLALAIPDRPDRRVLSIPRAGLSLRAVLERIITVLPAERQVQYQERLDRAGFHAVSRAAQRSALLSQIALSIEMATAPEEREAYLVSQLPHLFRDPNYATYLNANGGVADDLVTHIFEAPGYDRRDQRRRFESHDLPLDAIDIASLAAVTREFMRELRSNPDLVPLAIDVINANLDRAIGNALNFTGEQLIDLMKDLRRYLREDGKSLVLLIEDFARLQGVDSALLQALIEPASKDNSLCELRWAMAMTTGYYRRTADTVRTRMDFVVEMDLPTSGRHATFNDDQVVAFAAKYLNAVRADPGDLRAWSEIEVGESIPDGPPNACAGCEYRVRCHEAFGQQDGVGLYPFNRAAVLTMTSRVDSRFAERFNPRLLIRGVLAEVLGSRWYEFDLGMFPTESFLEAMRGSTLPSIQMEHLQQASPEFADRQAAVLELWGAPGLLTAVNAGVYSAFGLPVPLLPKQIPVKPAAPSSTILPTGSSRSDGVHEAAIQAIRAWGRGEQLPESAAARLRDPIYHAVVGYVDWDLAGIHQAAVTSRGDSTPFRSRNISFLHQATNPSLGRVTLQIPVTANRSELREAAIALEGLLEFKRVGSWSFPESDTAFGALRRSLARWAEALLGAIRGLEPGPNEVDAAVALLAVGAAMSGQVEATESQPLSLERALFEEWPAVSPGISPSWQRLYKSIRDQRRTLATVVRTWASGGKGGVVGAYVDASRIWPVLKQLRSQWALPEVDAAAEQPGPNAVIRLYREVAAELPLAVDAESRVVRDWVRRSKSQVGEGSSGRHFQSSLEELGLAASGAGLRVPKAVQDSFVEALGTFQPVLFDRAMQYYERLSGDEQQAVPLPNLSAVKVRSVMEPCSRLLDAADRFVAQIESAVDGAEEEMQQRTGSLAGDASRIHSEIDRLAMLLQDAEGADDA
jgi:hypothetical protein